jgi:hypothetical protein
MRREEEKSRRQSEL